MTPRDIATALLGIACIAMVVLAGCTAPAANPAAPTTAPATPAPTPSLPPAGPGTFDQSNNGGTYPVSAGAGVRLLLPENPTTGYTWNLSVSPGLSVLNDSYVPSDTTGKLVGSGGTHVWFLKADQAGEQVVSGLYRRPWEPAGNATGFRLVLDVSEAGCGGTVCTIATPTPSAVPPRYHVYTEADSGKSVPELPGETFGIRLAENPTTGYSWNLSLPAGLTLSRDEYLPSATSGQVAGAGGTRSFTLVAARAGAWNLSAEYRRPWVQAGTVTHEDLEGGFYGIVADDGTKYEPLDLDPKYQLDGLRVAFETTPAGDTVSTRMWGTPVHLSLIEEIPRFTLAVSVK